ncbi:MAG: YARHG domain-containing protein [Bacteroidales bacterium]|nr:YARHG domain-containing protein [Bacteroidales bacterium]
MKNKLQNSVLVLLFVLMCVTVKANDGIFYANGNHLVPMLETDISVRKEVLTIYLQNDGYARVDVSYEFWNPGKATKKLLMGFEAATPSYWEYEPEPEFSIEHPDIYNFTVEMNGQQLNYQVAFSLSGVLNPDSLIPTKELQHLSQMDPDFYFDSYVYYFDAEFQPGLNKIHHTYRYAMSSNVIQPWVLDYSLTPASRWAGGKIDDFTLIVRSDKQHSHFFMPMSIIPEAECTVIDGWGKTRKKSYSDRYGSFSWRKSYSDSDDIYMDFDSLDCYEVSVRNGAVSWHKKDFRPELELVLYGANFGDEVRDYYHDLNYDYPFEYFTSYDNTYDKELLRRVARNMPYAQHGRVFKDQKLKEFFESLWWYMPDPNYKGSDNFSKKDWLYINVTTD